MSDLLEIGRCNQNSAANGPVRWRTAGVLVSSSHGMQIRSPAVDPGGIPDGRHVHSRESIKAVAIGEEAFGSYLFRASRLSTTRPRGGGEMSVHSRDTRRACSTRRWD